jgi:bacteriocin-like protein
MSNEKRMQSLSDDLTKTKKPGDIQLDDEDLQQVSGGGVDGEAKDKDHKSA